MTTLKLIWAILFPYRAHLEAEIEYYRTLLAQRDRRIVELQDRIDSYMPDKPIVEPRPRVTYLGKVGPVRGWDDYRSTRRGKEFEETGEEASKGTQPQTPVDLQAGA